MILAPANEVVVHEFLRMQDHQVLLKWLKQSLAATDELLRTAPAGTVQQIQGHAQVLNELIQRVEAAKRK